MCEPISIGLTLAGTALNAIGQGQKEGAMKRDVAASGRQYDTYIEDTRNNFASEKEKQRGFFDKNQGVFADTLANYSRPNQQQLQDEATAKRQATYTAPLSAMSFATPVPVDAAPNSAVSNANARFADEAKAQSLAEAMSKAALDAYGDARTISSAKAANNASDIAITDQAATGSNISYGAKQNALDGSIEARQSVLPAKLNARQASGNMFSTLGDLFTAGSMIYGLGGGLGGLGQSVNEFGARNGIKALSGGLTYSNPLAGLPGSGVYSRPLAAL